MVLDCGGVVVFLLLVFGKDLVKGNGVSCRRRSFGVGFGRVFGVWGCYGFRFKGAVVLLRF